MAEDRNARAMARIDAALRRIELAAQGSPGSADQAVEQRYHQLWTQANGVLAELDQIIGSLER